MPYTVCGFLKLNRQPQILSMLAGSGDYMLVIGQTESGRYLTIILDDEGGGIWYPVTARPSNPSERRFANR